VPEVGLDAGDGRLDVGVGGDVEEQEPDIAGSGELARRRGSPGRVACAEIHDEALPGQAGRDRPADALVGAWKLATESVRTLVAADIMAATGLSDPDFGVLTRVVELGGGRMRQNLLAESMGYHRSRLSHHLSRMEDRGLVIREPVSGGVDVVATSSGAAAAAAARPAHAAAVRRHLLDPLADCDQAVFRAALDRLSVRA
jgi:DNA-binding MarR family transcriptional regulator